MLSFSLAAFLAFSTPCAAITWKANNSVAGRQVPLVGDSTDKEIHVESPDVEHGQEAEESSAHEHGHEAEESSTHEHDHEAEESSTHEHGHEAEESSTHEHGNEAADSHKLEHDHEDAHGHGDDHGAHDEHGHEDAPEHEDAHGHGDDHGAHDEHGHEDAHEHGDGHGAHDEHGHEDAHEHEDAHGHGDDHGAHDEHGHGDVHEHEDAHGHGDDHGAHDEHGHGDGHGAHGHGHEEYDPVAGSMAWMVFGNMAFIMALFYFVNFDDEDIRYETWCALKDMIAIFCAVLAFSALRLTMADFAEEAEHHHGPPTLTALCISIVRYAILIVTLEGCFRIFKKKPWHFQGFTTILGHLTGFAAIDVFGSIMQFPFLANSLVLSWCTSIVFSMVISSIAHSINTFTVDKAKGSHQWKHECIGITSDSAALASGLLISMTVRMSITGVLPPVHGAPRNKTFGQVWGLFAAAILLIPLVLGASMWKYRIHHRHEEDHDAADHPLVMRLSETLQMITSFSAGWTLLYWGYWEFYQTQGDNDEDIGPGGKMFQRLLMAIVFSVIVFAAIVGIDGIADRLKDPGLVYGFRSLLKTFSLLMGLSWEASFNEGVHAIGLGYEGHTKVAVMVLLSTITCLVVLPAWGKYIVPQCHSDSYEDEFLEESEESDEETKATPRKEARKSLLKRSNTIERVAKKVQIGASTMP